MTKGQSECANHNGATENLKWSKGFQIYMEKIRGLKILGLSEENTPGGYSPLKIQNFIFQFVLWLDFFQLFFVLSLQYPPSLWSNETLFCCQLDLDICS